MKNNDITEHCNKQLISLTEQFILSVRQTTPYKPHIKFYNNIY